jgi:uncharacterized GH25 family protein
MKRLAVAIVTFSALGGTAAAHDFWLQPRKWQAIPGIAMPISFEVGHGDARERWAAGSDKLAGLTEVSRRGAVNLRSLFREGGQQPHLVRTFREPGLHIVTMRSGDSFSDLPAIRFNDYLALEGLTPAIAARARSGRTKVNGREFYSRRAKALIQVGRPLPSDNALATRPVGMTLEIVPLRNPYALGGDHRLPVQILFEGRPLPGALVKLTLLESDAQPIKTLRSDARGRAIFTIPQSGSWLVNVIWTKAIASRDADFQTTFSSLTFGYPVRRER